MNAVEIEEAVSALSATPFDPAAFAYSFLAAFGMKETTLKRLRTGQSNASDIAGAVLQRNNIHIAVSSNQDVGKTLAALRESPKTASAKAKFLLATDGTTVEAEDLTSGEVLSCAFTALGDHFGFFLALAGISTVREIKNNPIDVKATGRLNKLYIELLRDNPDWGTAEKRTALNQFMARLIFCFFAEDTGIFRERQFTQTVDRMSDPRSSNTDEILSELFRAMDTKPADRAAAKLRPWANEFPWVNGGLFAGTTDCPKFTRIARSYLLRAGELNWREINPDIFGSMIQAVADEDERGALGLHYTSIPNILKVLNPLFLDDLRAKLDEAGDNARTLLNLRKRIARIRVFDPACGSGNFLVVAYKEMRAIEAAINSRRLEEHLKSEIPLTNFRGIELRDFPAEIARLALIIAKYQCDVLYRGQKEALAEFLPLDAMNWITCGNALRLDWLSICRPTGTAVKHQADDLFHTPLDQAQIDFENEGGETYICGNPPYLGFTWQSPEQKGDMEAIFESRVKGWKSLDYVAGWFMKAADYGTRTSTAAAFVATNSICQGEQVPILWPLILGTGHEIDFAYTSFKWANLASYNAGVTVVIVGISNSAGKARRIYSATNDQSIISREVEYINAYLVPGPAVIVDAVPRTPSGKSPMVWGNKPTDGGHLVLSDVEKRLLEQRHPEAARFLRPYYGAAEYIRGLERFCIWVDDTDAGDAKKIPALRQKFEQVRAFRAASKAAETRPAAAFPHRFRQIQSVATTHTLIIPQVSSERREFLPIGLLPQRSIVSNLAFALYDAPLWNMALIASRLHLIWIATVCGKLETRYRYSNTLGWNTFPVPMLTEQNRRDLTATAENILLAREAHYPASIADLYDPDTMPEDLRRAHDANDEILERIYIGRRFKNDTERLEKLFDMYSKMVASQPPSKKKGKRAA